MLLSRENDSLTSSESSVSGSYSDWSGSDEESDDAPYRIDQTNLYIDVKVFKHDHTCLQLNVDLNRYPKMKDDLLNLFNIKVSLIDLARKLENDLIIIEVTKGRFKLAFKDDIFAPVATNTETDEIHDDIGTALMSERSRFGK